MQRIQVSKDGRHFAFRGTSAAFVVWGFNYDHDASGRLIEDYWSAEWPTVVSDFREMKALGANVVRIHLQVAAFLRTAKVPNPVALKQLARLVKLAEDTGLYLNLTGLGCYHKKDVPPWYDKLDEAERWEAQAVFWAAVAKVCARSPAVFCYDLMNEPILPGIGKPETQWLVGEFAGKTFVQRITLDLAGRRQEDVAKKWIETLAVAIRKHDRQGMITLGIIPWALVFPGAKTLFYEKGVGEPLDFVSVHFYPKKGEISKALAALATYDIGRPLLIGEMFPLECSIDELDRFVEGSRKHASGWLGFYWGKTIDEYAKANKPEITGALTRQWLEYFRRKSEERESLDRLVGDKI